MKKQARLVLAGVTSLIFVVAVWAVPPAAHNSNSLSAAAIEQTVPQTKSTSGTISAVEKTSFTITLVPTNRMNATDPVARQDAPNTMTFVVDKNTTIEGKLQVGSNADVTYRDDSSGNHVAIGVHVSPPKM